ncbi:chromophore lyase CpcT/CpeT [Gloeocapsopsis dulcis]|uniref:Chromophore lyase CpcT/CpeT n=1 Tax=Gloeocapsopsis dulcis AAB1 = 1H9 TaxID=1433147 RepID=A0A6N8FT39_9CHRO|nr:chromophore lyase CpcT/CpeT [Gloeocapsopsis dulcis]MUL36278.1 chorismate mutase [Gloeocapsopsis dulcis AAB1 = 1H9]WNN89611.1 chromophore lyase CpcT/CpeT [Gloeocapsopsis dulcis]
MNLSSELTALAQYLTGEFTNQEQAIAEPAWYVHLRLWHQPVSLFTEDSFTLFAEQANILKLDQPYRQRLIRIQQFPGKASLQVQYYMPKNPTALRGAGANPAILKSLTPDQFELLPGCLLDVTANQLERDCAFLSAEGDRYHFKATLPPDRRCCFSYAGNTVQVSIGFEATPEEFLSYDKGIDSTTGKATWGAILGPYRFRKVK